VRSPKRHPGLQKQEQVMSNSNAFIRELANIQPTAKDVGLEMTINVKLYDKGGCEVNGKLFTSPTRTTTVARQILQMLEEIEADWHKRQQRLAA
jgi:hypothetical protein